MEGRFIVFEGIDGCGKGTQIKMAASYIFDMNKENDVYITREPTRDFKEIRKRMAAGNDAKKDAEWYASAFVEDRKNHIKNYIEPMLKKGTHVLCDRYKYSTLAYQHTQGIELKKLIDMHKGFPVPDLTIVFDLPAEVAFERRKKEGATDVFDKDLKFQEELRQNYLKLKNEFKKENIVVIDAARSAKEIFEDVKKEINKLF